MLTGDKLETAENVGYLCSLISKDTKVFRIQAEYMEEATYILTFYILKINNNNYVK